MKVVKRILDMFQSTCLSTKALLVLGVVCLANTILSVFLDSSTEASPEDVAIRSVMSSIFGFIFGTQLAENTNINNRNLQTISAITVAFACLFTSIFTHWFFVEHNTAASVEIRNLMFSAVGFLISRARHSV